MEGFQKHPVERNIPPEMIAATASWAIYGAAKQWVNTPDRIPAEGFRRHRGKSGGSPSSWRV